MNKDFMMGAELALRGAGIQDERVKQDLMSRLTNAKLAESTQDLERNEGYNRLVQEFSTPDPNATQTWGGADYLGANVPNKPGLGSPEFFQKAIGLLEPQQAVTAMIAQQKPTESFEQRLYRELAVARERAGGKGNEPGFYEKENYKAALRAKEKTGETEVKDPNKSDYQLTRDSLRETLGKEPTATEIQTAMDERSNKKASALTDAKNAGMDIPSLAKAVMDGQDAPIAIKGSMGNPVSTKIKSEVLKTYPKFSFQMADANYQWARSAANQRTIAMIQGALPRVQMLTDQINALGNTDYPSLNAIMKKVALETGKPQYTSFDANRNAIVQEINTALSGSATSSDMRVRIELENIQSSRSPQQLVGAINNLNEALLSRWESTMDGPYPLEVVRGEMSMADYKKQFLAKFRGKFTSDNSTKGFDLDAINTELERRKGGGK